MLLQFALGKNKFFDCYSASIPYFTNAECFYFLSFNRLYAALRPMERILQSSSMLIWKVIDSEWQLECRYSRIRSIKMSISVLISYPMTEENLRTVANGINDEL